MNHRKYIRWGIAKHGHTASRAGSCQPGLPPTVSRKGEQDVPGDGRGGQGRVQIIRQDHGDEASSRSRQESKSAKQDQVWQ